MFYCCPTTVTVTTPVYCCSHYSCRAAPRHTTTAVLLAVKYDGYTHFVAVPSAWLALHIAKCVNKRSLAVATILYSRGVHTKRASEYSMPLSLTNVAQTPVDRHAFLCHIPISVWPSNISLFVFLTLQPIAVVFSQPSSGI
jgi:hypothetical protein